MMDELLAATLALADVLETENEALAALDMARAASLLGRKAPLTESYTAARARAAAGLPVLSPQLRATLLQATSRLDTLARDNRRLLSHAIRVQGRIMEFLTRAAGRERQAPTYGAHGRYAQAHRRPLTLSARA